MKHGTAMRRLGLLMGIGVITISLSMPKGHASILGEENIALAKLVMGQLVELERLAEIVEASQENIRTLQKINDGIQKVVAQIQGLETLAQRVQGVQPSSIRDLASLNRELMSLKQIAAASRQVVDLKLELAESTVAQASVQSESAFEAGSEFMVRGAALASEAVHASPNRANQLAASAQSAGVIAQGAELQALSHLIQLQAQSLELMRLQTQNSLEARRATESAFGEMLKVKTQGHGALRTRPRKGGPEQ